MDTSMNGFSTQSGRERAVQECQEIVTERLSLRPVADAVAPDIFATLDLTVTRYMVPRPAAKIEETRSFIERSQRSKEEGSELVLTVHRRETGEFLGGCGLHACYGPKAPEIGIWLKSAAHGNGFGKEAVLGMMKWAEENLDIEQFIYPVDRNNGPSRRIPESLGGRVIGEAKKISMSNIELDTIVFSLPPLSQGSAQQQGSAKESGAKAQGD